MAAKTSRISSSLRLTDALDRSAMATTTAPSPTERQASDSRVGPHDPFDLLEEETEVV